MDRIRVRSSNVASVGYDPATSTLEIEFTNGDIYHYLSVPVHHFEALTSGVGSVGRYLNSKVKPYYRYTRLR
jgi:hypothetical protein